MRISKGKKIRIVCLSAVCLALCMVLPFLTGMIPVIGKALCPMHIPVLICGALCGPWWGALVGVIAPLLRGVLFGAPELIPTGLSMAAELFGYGFFMGIFVKILPRKAPYLYVSLIFSMLAGRMVGGVSKIVLLTSGILEEYSFALFFSGYFVNSLPAFAIQLVLVPPIIYAVKKAKIV